MGSIRDGKMLLVLKVELGNGRTGAIEVRQGDSFRELALQFCDTYKLDALTVAEPLVSHIADSVREITAAKARAEQESPARSSSPSPERIPPSIPPSLPKPTSGPRRMDGKIAEALRRDLERERERRMKELQAEAGMRRKEGGVGEGQQWQRRARPSFEYGTDPPPNSQHYADQQAGAAEVQRPASARGHGAELKQYRHWMNENCSVAAGERMYSEAMRKIAERRQSVCSHVELATSHCKYGREDRALPIVPDG